MALWLTQRFGPMATQARKRPLDGPLAAEDEEQKRLKLADVSEKIRREINTAGMKQDARKALELFDEALERPAPQSEVLADDTPSHLGRGGLALCARFP